ncbi:hypothetical protein BDZ94DRAFT_1262724 [Collybia nuda]|uniref:Uncharacterized protein n=1 Tax=Collybia nuda TaxID=64659 RepID=A0A9P5Y3Z6_9AGAR|nr:hypothetical protein BDZ94DRAFT_1262724 [Collybia nuda]
MGRLPAWVSISSAKYGPSIDFVLPGSIDFSLRHLQAILPTYLFQKNSLSVILLTGTLVLCNYYMVSTLSSLVLIIHNAYLPAFFDGTIFNAQLACWVIMITRTKQI